MRQELIELEKIIGLLKNMSVIFKQDGGTDEEMLKGVFITVEEINRQVYGCAQLSSVVVQTQTEDIVRFNQEFDAWLKNLSDELEYRKQIHKKIDYEFHIFSEHIKEATEKELIQESIECLKRIRANNRNHYEALRGTYTAYYFFWGHLDLESNNIELIENRVHEMKSHWEDFCWLYDNLEDYRSKKVLYGILQYWLKFDLSVKNSIKETNYDDYYDFDIITCNDDEVFVDLGAWNGDSAQSFIDNYGAYRRIYCYEMTEQSIQEAKKRLENHDNIIYRQVAVGDKEGTMHMYNFHDTSSNVVMDGGDIEVPMVCLDDDIEEPITFLKMDIEGSELNAMKGAEQHIRNDKPKLAICSYHNNHHIYEIPKLMREYNPDYKIYMRYNGVLNHPLVSEFVTFGI